jgi:hypothetical protein
MFRKRRRPAYLSLFNVFQSLLALLALLGMAGGRDE